MGEVVVIATRFIRLPRSLEEEVVFGLGWYAGEPLLRWGIDAGRDNNFPGGRTLVGDHFVLTIVLVRSLKH